MPSCAPCSRDEGETVLVAGRWLSRILKYLKPHRALLVVGVISMAVTAIGIVEIPDMIRRVVDAAIKAHDAQLLANLLIAFLALTLLTIGANFMEQTTVYRLSQRVIFDIRREMFSHLQDLSLSLMDKTHEGRIMACIHNDVNTLQDLLEASIGTVRDVVALIGITFVLLSLDWKLGFLTLTVIPMLVAAQRLWLPHSKRAFNLARETSA